MNACGQVLAEQSIGVFIGASLPGVLRVTELDLDIGCQVEPLVLGHFRAPVPGQGQM